MDSRERKTPQPSIVWPRPPWKTRSRSSGRCGTRAERTLSRRSYARLRDLKPFSAIPDEKLLLSELLDALVLLDETSDGSELGRLAQSPYSCRKILAHAMRFPKKRWPLILSHLETFVDGLDREVAWTLGWTHHRDRLVLHMLHDGAEVDVDVVEPAQDGPRGMIGLGSGGGGSFGRPASPKSRGKPTPHYSLTECDPGAADPSEGQIIASMMSFGRRLVMVRRLLPDAMELEGNEEFKGRAEWRTEAQFDAMLPSSAPSLRELQRGTLRIEYISAATYRRLVEGERDERLKKLLELHRACVAKGWITKAQAAGVRRVRVLINDHRKKPREELPFIPWIQPTKPPSVDHLATASVEDAIRIVRELRDAGRKDAVPAFRARLRGLRAYPRSPNQKLLISELLDSLVLLDDMSEGADLRRFIRSPYSKRKVLAYAMRFPEQRGPLIRDFLDTSGDDLHREVTWTLAWSHHRARLVLDILHNGASLSFLVTDPEPSKGRGRGAFGGPRGVPRARPVPSLDGKPTAQYSLVKCDSENFAPEDGQIVASVMSFGRRLAMVRRLLPDAMVPEGKETIRTRRRYKGTRDQFDSMLPWSAPSLKFLRSGLLTIRYTDAASFRKRVEAERDERLMRLLALHQACIAEAWITKAQAAGVRRVAIRIYDRRSSPREPLPDIAEVAPTKLPWIPKVSMRGTLRMGSAVEAIPIVRHARDRQEKGLIPDLYARLVKPLAPETIGGRALRALIIDALVKLDRYGDGSELRPFIEDPFCRIKVIAFAAKEADRRWPLIEALLESRALSSGSARILAWKHHRERFLEFAIQEAGKLAIRATTARSTPAFKAPDLGRTTSSRSCREPIGPGIRYREVLRGTKPEAGEKYVTFIYDDETKLEIYRSLTPDRLPFEGLGRDNVWYPRAVDHLEKRLERPGLGSFPEMVDVSFTTAEKWEASVREIRKKHLSALDELLDACVEKEWLRKEKAAGLRHLKLEIVDRRPLPRAPLPKLDF